MTPVAGGGGWPKPNAISPEIDPGAGSDHPGGPATAGHATFGGDTATLVGASAAGSDEWRADVIHSLQRTSGNRAVARMSPTLDADTGHGPRAAAAAKKKTGIGSDRRRSGWPAPGKVEDELGQAQDPGRGRAKSPRGRSRVERREGPGLKLAIRNLGPGNLGEFNFVDMDDGARQVRVRGLQAERRRHRRGRGHGRPRGAALRAMVPDGAAAGRPRRERRHDREQARDPEVDRRGAAVKLAQG